jgi:hypothetical protein
MAQHKSKKNHLNRDGGSDLTRDRSSNKNDAKWAPRKIFSAPKMVI